MVGIHRQTGVRLFPDDTDERCRLHGTGIPHRMPAPVACHDSGSAFIGVQCLQTDPVGTVEWPSDVIVRRKETAAKEVQFQHGTNSFTSRGTKVWPVTIGKAPSAVFDLSGHQDLVDAGPVFVHHLDPVFADSDEFSDFGQAVAQVDDPSGDGRE